MMPNNRIGELIDAEIDRLDSVDIPPQPCTFLRPKQPNSNKVRRYFGGSQLGGNCRRQRWYGFHWSAFEKFDARMLRLFNRGHREEERLIQYLRMIGVEVEEYDPDTVPTLWHHAARDEYAWSFPKNWQNVAGYVDVTNTFHEWIACSRGLELPEPRQFSFEDMDGHHRGNCDGRGRFIPDQNQWGIPLDAWVLLEFKTHNQKSFDALIATDVYQGKPDHWKQMQRYMEKIGFSLGLYGAVCKNTDRFYWEFIPFEPSWAEQAAEIAREAVYSEKPPIRLSNSPSYYECKWCIFRPQCHYNAPMLRNCRTCISSFPTTNGDWACNIAQRKIPRSVEEVGCELYKQRTD